MLFATQNVNVCDSKVGVRGVPVCLQRPRARAFLCCWALIACCAWAQPLAAECVDNTGCEAPFVCDASPSLECDVTEPCELCACTFVTRGTCVPPTSACVRNADCLGGYVCAQFTFGDCDARGDCDPFSQGLCVPPYVPDCARDADCGEGFVCGPDSRCEEVRRSCGPEAPCPPYASCRASDEARVCVAFDDGRVTCGAPLPEPVCVAPLFAEWADLGDDVRVTRADGAPASSQPSEEPDLAGPYLGDEGCAAARPIRSVSPTRAAILIACVLGWRRARRSPSASAERAT